ncbi:MAG: AbrB/MazE/SpoVT family DNA-binding domain-containing protein [Thermoplasmata archaeon]
MATEVGTLSTKGQVTIPKDIREALGIRPGDKIRFDLEGGERAVLQKAEPSRMNDILGRLGPTKAGGVELQRRLRSEWSKRPPRH